ncbi:hypothetical protein IQ264_04225 [Phormidium sp. LEGE 05292]|uniref:hypothetical protein n=1 Tax=[Phormidium] sp. LEGE 05292 TaxID=767427 RepID=UPI00187FC2FE|nr:hypothetical protein [Phormidium sp. LEGE 05292]MBE9224676.1 hypothetical protein [Phormidium sp. LEGE 05292]
MNPVQKLTIKKKRLTGKLLFERVMAAIVLLNFTLVIFDLTYIYWRNFWLQGNLRLVNLTINVPLPPITKWYDPVKGIEPHRDTASYLNTVDQLKQQISQTGLQSPEVKKLLADLQLQSVEMIETNPFAVANKTGTLEKIKNRMRRHLDNDSAKESFREFWSYSFLSQRGWEEELAYFKRQIQPLIETNYFRPIGENGQPVDFFFERIDWVFFLIFSLELIGRVIYISRNNKGVSWREAILWRWYDIFLLLPFWRPLRIISVYMRLKQCEIKRFDRFQRQVNQLFIANFAEEIIEVVVVGVINQIQDSIRQGDLRNWLSQSQNRTYIDLNNTDEVAEISNIVTRLAVYRIFPKVQPDIELLLQHNIESVLQNLPAYRSVQAIPGLANLPKQLTERLVAEISQATYQGLTSAIEDPVGAKLSGNLVNHLGEAIAQELRNQHTIERIQSLLIDMLEEIKINYVERLSQEDMQQIIEQTRQLRQRTAPKAVEILPYKQI